MGKKREYTKLDIKHALGAVLALFSLVVLLSPTSNFLYGLGIGVFYLFGFTGYWLLIPALFIVGVCYFLMGSLPGGKNSGRVVLAYVLCYIGISLIVGRYCLAEAPSLGGLALYNGGDETFGMGYVSANSLYASMPLMPEFGGGILIYLLLVLLENGTSVMAGLLGGLLILGGIVAALWAPITKGIASMRSKGAIKKARRQEEKARRDAYDDAVREQREYQELMKKYLGEDSPTPSFATPVYEEPAPAPIAAPVSTLSRVAENRNRIDNPAIPRETRREEPQKILNLSAAELRNTSLTEAKLKLGNTQSETASLYIEPAPQPAPKPAYVSPVIEPAALKPEPVPQPAPQPAPQPIPEPIIAQPAPQPIPEPEPVPEKPEDFYFGGEDEVPETIEEPVTPRVAEGTFLMPEPEPIPEPVPEPIIQTAPAPQPAPQPMAQPIPQPAIQPAPQPDPMPQPAPVQKPLEPYVKPTSNLLKEYGVSQNAARNEEEAKVRCETINKTFEDLGIPAQAIGYTIGPSVTRFDIQTAANYRVSGLSNVIQDICVRLDGVTARFEQVVRGKSTSGLEVPNSVTATVPFKEMFEALPSNEDGKKNLYIPFGKSITGECMSSDLSEFPHMLVAGTTGSGKSIFVHGVLMSLIMRNDPDDLKLVLVDPKRVEMTKYKNLPHLLCPIVKEPSEAKVCLDKLAIEMERRYRLFEEAGVSNIRQYNGDYVPYEPGTKKLPFIVVVVDEFADLKLTCKDIDEVIIRLTSKARAAGIHLIIATQRPSADIVTGPIKANLGVKVALMVSNSLNSRVILDQDGAETLLGKGDMLVDCPMMVRGGLARLQGCFVDNHEIAEVCDYIRSQREPDYNPDFLDLVDHEAEAKEAEREAAKVDTKALKAASDEELYQEVKRNVMGRDYASVSYIQTMFAVGHPKASRLFARLQDEGVVSREGSSSTNNKGCRVLLHMQDMTGMHEE